MTSPPTPTAAAPSDKATTSLEEPVLSLDEIGKANRRAQIDGVVAGVAAGSVSSQISLRVFKQTRNAALLSGLLAGAGVGYLFARETLRLQLTKAQKANVDLRKHLAEQGAAPPTEAELWDLDRGEGGAPGTGLETMQDKYNTASGDH